MKQLTMLKKPFLPMVAVMPLPSSPPRPTPSSLMISRATDLTQKIQVELATDLCEDFTITEKAFSWLKASTRSFTCQTGVNPQ